MIFATGLDVVETDRVARALAAHGWPLRGRVSTLAKLTNCAQPSDWAQALRRPLAASEAFRKVLGPGQPWPRAPTGRSGLVDKGSNSALPLTGAPAAEARRRPMSR
jgi:phosphopantetheinyl transferase (holo-ACP synthase)